jgi:hypothetical protein
VAKKQTFTLDFVPDYDFIVIGIYCAYRDYRVCFELNRVLNLGLVRKDDLQIHLEKKGSSGEFSWFFQLNDDEEEYYLVSNKGTHGYFIPELKPTDYFLVIKNPSRYTQPEDLERRIRFVAIISSTVEIDPHELKSAENFLLLEPVFGEEKKPKLPPVK